MNFQTEQKRRHLSRSLTSLPSNNVIRVIGRRLKNRPLSQPLLTVMERAESRTRCLRAVIPSLGRRGSRSRRFAVR